MYLTMNRFKVVTEHAEAFEAWTKSEAFREAHRKAGDNKHMYLDAPTLEIFESVQELT